MRVIAGTFRSRALKAPAGRITRPTSDRLRETLFNILSAQVPGCRFADLYAGSGAVGIEAVSRGAADVLFAEKEAAALAVIRSNLRTLGIVDGVSVAPSGVAAFLRKASAKPFDILFLDPPYEDVDEYTTTLSALGQPGTSLLHHNSLVIAEHTRKQPLQDRYGTLARTRTLLQGDAALSFFKPQQQPPNVPQRLD